MSKRNPMKVKCAILVMMLMVSSLFVVISSSSVSALTNTNFEYEYVNGVEVRILGYIGSGNSVTIPSMIDERPVTSIGYAAFSESRDLISVNIPNSVKTIGDVAFSYCTSLTSLTIPASVTSIGNSAFRDCTSLTSVNNLASVTSIGNAVFFHCTSLTSVTIPASVTSIGNNAFRECTSLTSVTIPASVTSIGDYAFSSCSALTSLAIPSSVNTLGSGAFASCTSLTHITIPASVTSIGSYAFSQCSAMTQMYFVGNAPACGMDWMTGHSAYLTIYYYYGMTGFTNPWHGIPTVCLTSLADFEHQYINADTEVKITGFHGPGTNVVIPGMIDGRPVTSIGDSAFYHCTSLVSVIIPIGVTSIGNGSFASCTSLTSVTIPVNVVSIGLYAFEVCTNLTSVTIPAGVTSIGAGAFSTCSILKTIDVSAENANYASVEGVLYDKAKTTLIQCPGGRSGTLVIPSGVTTIGENAFASCASLGSVSIPASVTTIMDYAFFHCDSLTKMYFGHDAPTCGTNWIADHNANLTIYYYYGNAGFLPIWYGVTTKCLYSHSARQNLQTTAPGTYIVLRWEPATSTGDPSITGYKIFYGLREPTTQFGDALPSGALTVNVTGLVPGMLYHFTVKEISASGETALSGNLTAILMDVPNAPTGLTNTTTSTQVSLAWTAPNGSVTGYRVYRGISAVEIAYLGNSSSTDFVDASVTNGTRYYYAVSATNVAGEGTQSDVKIVTVPSSLIPMSGRVVDSNGNGLAGIAVTLENGSSVRTDDQGRFVLMTMPGNNTITIDGPGIETRTMVASVSSSISAIGDITTSKRADYLPIIMVVIGITALLVMILTVVRRRKVKK